MPGDRRIQFQVAVELDYQKEKVHAALEVRKFATAGDLVDYLMMKERSDDNVSKASVNDNVSKASVNDNESIQNENDAVAKQSVNNDNEIESSLNLKTTASLREETEWLYYKSLCLVCHDRKRTHVSCPCGHLSHCSGCDKDVKICPYPRCDTEVLNTIYVYSVF